LFETVFKWVLSPSQVQQKLWPLNRECAAYVGISNMLKLNRESNSYAFVSVRLIDKCYSNHFQTWGGVMSVFFGWASINKKDKNVVFLLKKSNAM
jgi:hypothetical protein